MASDFIGKDKFEKVYGSTVHVMLKVHVFEEKDSGGRFNTGLLHLKSINPMWKILEKCITEGV